MTPTRQPLVLRTPLHIIVATALLCSLIACSGDMCKNATKNVVSKTVKTSKDTVTGLKEGIQEGRKQGESIDSARVVTSIGELDKYGELEIYDIQPQGGQSLVTLAVVNEQNERPLRLDGLEVLVIDKESFSHKPSRSPDAVTVAPEAKAKTTFTVRLPPDQIKELRLWGDTFPVPKRILNRK